MAKRWAPTDNRSLKEKLKDLAAMHSGERRGFFIVMVLLVLSSAYAGYMKFYYEPPERDLVALTEKMNAWVVVHDAELNADSAVLPEPFPFNPNEIERKEWLALGLTDHQVDGIEKFVTKGGQFRSKKDVERMYSINAKLYARLEPFIQLPDEAVKKEWPKKEWPKPEPREPYEKKNYEPYVPKTYAKAELNTADSLTLVALPGIGPSFAKGILKFRKMLGGFHSLDQLNEVYVLRDKPDAVARIKELVTLDPSAAKHININTCTEEELGQHPYAGWKLSKTLIAYRTHHGRFATVSDIKNCLAVTDPIYDQLSPYLVVE